MIYIVCLNSFIINFTNPNTPTFCFVSLSNSGAGHLQVYYKSLKSQTHWLKKPDMGQKVKPKT